MKFLFTIYHDEKTLDDMPEREMQALVDSALDYDEEIRRSGHYIVSNALQRARTARTLRVRGDKVSITDGPFAETKEQLGGFFLIEARDMDEACAVAARFPPARIGIIEVRPVNELRHS
ncbi:MAG TPA: YciI family protein [Methylomirabilota bacterium]|nr:YciI family protein [Methylomirabilota bacterium]